MNTHPRRFLALAILASTAILVAFAGVSYIIIDNREDTQRQAAETERAAEQDRKVLCDAGNRSNQAITDILNLARSLNGQAPITVADCRPRVPKGEEFYCRALDLLEPIPCGT